MSNTSMGMVAIGIPVKQRLINYVERIKPIDWRFYESPGFVNVEILMAPEFAVRELINNLPRDFYCHINSITNKLEIFTDA